MPADSLVAFTVSVDGEEWSQATSLENAGADDKMFLLDAESGSVHFGDGVHGRRPASGASVTVSYRKGGGAAGNMAISTTFFWPPKIALLRVALTADGVNISSAAAAVEEYSGEKRPNYFAGKLLAADDFADEQSYLLAKQRRHNRELHGWGVVSGLEVSAGTSAASIMVAPGYGAGSLRAGAAGVFRM